MNDNGLVTDDRYVDATDGNIDISMGLIEAENGITDMLMTPLLIARRYDFSGYEPNPAVNSQKNNTQVKFYTRGPSDLKASCKPTKSEFMEKFRKDTKFAFEGIQDVNYTSSVVLGITLAQVISIWLALGIFCFLGCCFRTDEGLRRALLTLILLLASFKIFVSFGIWSQIVQMSTFGAELAQTGFDVNCLDQYDRPGPAKPS